MQSRTTLLCRRYAIRENTIYIHGNPQVPDSRSQVYLDIEGLPESDFYYLVGAFVVSDGQETLPIAFGQIRSQMNR